VKKLYMKYSRVGPGAVRELEVKSVQYNGAMRAVRLEHTNGDVEYINFDCLELVRELAPIPPAS
jgi:hypothetical protein